MAQSDVKCRTLTEAYRRHGIDNIRDIRRAWSQQGGDGTVVLTLWADLFEDTSRRVYDTLKEPLRSWVDTAKNKRRIAHLKHVQSLADPIFKSIIVIPADGSRSHSKGWEVGHDMRLTHVDSYGRFRAVRAGD